MTGPAFQHLFTLDLETVPWTAGQGPFGFVRSVAVVGGGSFRGDRLAGRVLPGGADWIMGGPSGVRQLDVRLMLETDAGEMVAMSYAGRLHMTAETEAQLRAGDQPDPSAVYFRVAAQFETASERLAWLNRRLAFGIGVRRPSGPVYEVYELL